MVVLECIYLARMTVLSLLITSIHSLLTKVPDLFLSVRSRISVLLIPRSFLSPDTADNLASVEGFDVHPLDSRSNARTTSVGVVIQINFSWSNNFEPRWPYLFSAIDCPAIQYHPKFSRQGEHNYNEPVGSLSYSILSFLSFPSLLQDPRLQIIEGDMNLALTFNAWFNRFIYIPDHKIY